MAADEPPYLTVGTDVSAKYKGAFCEAKIKKVNRMVKCKITFKNNQGNVILTDDQLRGTLRVGAHVEAKHPEKNQYIEAVINKIIDYSQYTVVFDDGDETTLRRTSLCLKSGRHFAESETLDQLPLTNPEHFGTPVMGTKAKRKRRSTMNSASIDDDSSDDESARRQQKVIRRKDRESDIGKVIIYEVGDKRKKDSWLPCLVVSPSSQENMKISQKEDYLIRSFKDGKFYQVPKKDVKEFTKDTGSKSESSNLKTAIEKAVLYLEKGELPSSWDKTLLMGLNVPSGDDDSQDSDSDTSDDEPSEEKDRFVAQLYKFMDERGTPINRAPTVGNRDLNLYKLFKIVHKIGGYNRVTNQNAWKSVHVKMGLPLVNSSSSNQIKSAYKRYLHSFEDFYRKLGCTMAMTIRSSRTRQRSDRNFIMTRNRKQDNKEKNSEDKYKLEEDNNKDKVAKSNNTKEVDSEQCKVDDKNKSKDESNRVRTREDKRREKAESPDKKDGKQTAKNEVKDDDKNKKESTKDKKEKNAKEKKEDKMCKDKKDDKITNEHDSKGEEDNKGKNDNNSTQKKQYKKKNQQPSEKSLLDNKKDNSDEENDGNGDEDVEIGDRVKVKYGRGRVHKIYEAKVLKVDRENGDRKFYVHYTGWNTRYDEWVKKKRIMENVSEKNINGKKKKLANSLKGMSKTPGRRGRPPNSVRLANLTDGSTLLRKNSTNSMASSTSNSRTMRSDRNSLSESPFVNGLEPRRRARRKSGVSINVEASPDLDSDDHDNSEFENLKIATEEKVKQHTEEESKENEDKQNEIDIQIPNITNSMSENENSTVENLEVKVSDSSDMDQELKDLSDDKCQILEPCKPPELPDDEITSNKNELEESEDVLMKSELTNNIIKEEPVNTEHDKTVCEKNILNSDKEISETKIEEKENAMPLNEDICENQINLEKEDNKYEENQEQINVEDKQDIPIPEIVPEMPEIIKENIDYKPINLDVKDEKCIEGEEEELPKMLKNRELVENDDMEVLIKCPKLECEAPQKLKVVEATTDVFPMKSELNVNESNYSKDSLPDISAEYKEEKTISLDPIPDELPHLETMKCNEEEIEVYSESKTENELPETKNNQVLTDELLHEEQSSVKSESFSMLTKMWEIETSKIESSEVKEEIPNLENVTEIQKPSEILTPKKDVKKKKSKGLKLERKSLPNDNQNKDDGKLKEGKNKSKKKYKIEGEDSEKSKILEGKLKQKKFKKNKTKKKLEKSDTNCESDIKPVEIKEEVNEKAKKEKKKKDDKKSKIESKPDTDGKNIDNLKKEKKKGKKNKEKVCPEKKNENNLEKKCKKKKKLHNELEIIETDSEKEAGLKIDPDKIKLKKGKKKKKSKDNLLDDLSDLKFPKDNIHKKQEKKLKVEVLENNTPAQELVPVPKFDNETEQDIAFLLCEEKVPASPVGNEEVPLPTSSHLSQIEDLVANSTPAALAASEVLATISESVSNGALTYPKGINHMLVTEAANRHESEVAAVLDNTPPNTPDSTELALYSSPIQENYSLHDGESTRSGRDSADGDSDSLHIDTAKLDVAESEDSLVFPSLSNSSSHTEKNNQVNIKSGSTNKRHRNELDEISPSKRKKKSNKRLSSSDITKSNVNRKMPFSKCLKGDMQINENNTSDYRNSIFSSHTVSSSSTSNEASLSRPSKFNFDVHLDESMDSDKRIAILQEKLLQIKKVYLTLKAEVALIDRRRKKAKRKEKEAAQSSNSVSQLMEVQCSS
ncbi:AT-rich interactive domain-containing protein 4A-like isoform X2 [Centruroides vittatus]|uniref:AT-rich interactive domain-containing protein 4A-like isoform X2 n=1 Tax=Centruroides vittatus TaxID=120091 RepID=UPI00350F27B6